ncbi:MAG: hypothetical protein H3C43_04040 [Leptonema sp. (in: Bacteria)]|nr:hypothetical protein [Leptonema sp. (in: bacteria)]
MPTISELKRRFLTAFSDEQSSLLADIFYSNYDSFAKSSDLKELTEVVTELAKAQKNTDTTVKELVEAQKNTDTTVKELVEAQKNTGATVKELAEAQKRTEVKVEELAEAQKRTEVKIEELAEAQKRTEVGLEQTSKGVRNLAKQIGGLSEALGGSLEDFALDMVPELLEKYWNLQIISCSREEVEIDDRTIEFDIFIEGLIDAKKIIVIGEVKSNITKEEVKKHYKQVEMIRPLYPDSEIRVVFFGYRAYREVRELISSLGGSMIFTNSKSL